MLWQVWELKKMYDKYQELQKKLKNLLIRAKQWKYKDNNGEEQEWAVVIEMTGEMKIQNISINDLSLLSVDSKSNLEETIKDAFKKAQEKTQEIVAKYTKEILGFDPSDLANMMWGGGGFKLPWM